MLGIPMVEKRWKAWADTGGKDMEKSVDTLGRPVVEKKWKRPGARSDPVPVKLVLITTRTEGG